MRFLIISCILIILGCSKSTENLPIGLKYFPDIDLLEEGVVFKYYYHKGKKSDHYKTDIIYRKMVLKGDVITNEDYNAGFQKTRFYEIEMQGSKWLMTKENSYSFRNDNTSLVQEYTYSFKDNVSIDWEYNEASLEKKIDYDGYGSRIVQTQNRIIDSTVNDNAIKIIHGKRMYHSIIEKEEKDPVELSLYRRYEQGLGLTQSILSNEELNFDLVLDEIMTLGEFESRAAHGTHRVGYIDTLETIDDHTLFNTCFHPDKINDYYNDDRAGFLGGKGRLKAILKEKLVPSKIKNESGYLTFRFVVNCNGEAGWFVTEEAGLDYDKKKFSQECKMHLYNILKTEKNWKNLKIGQDARDAYTYITFKIKNGTIIEILP